MDNSVTRKINDIDRLLDQIQRQQIASRNRFEEDMARMTRIYQQKQRDMEIKRESLLELRLRTVNEHQDLVRESLLHKEIEVDEREMWAAVDGIEDDIKEERDLIEAHEDQLIADSSILTEATNQLEFKS